jgi:hypothetical protein
MPMPYDMDFVFAFHIKLHKKHNKEDVVVIEKMQNGKLVVTQGNIQTVKGEYKVHIIGHGHKDKKTGHLVAIRKSKLTVDMERIQKYQKEEEY